MNEKNLKVLDSRIYDQEKFKGRFLVCGVPYSSITTAKIAFKCKCEAMKKDDFISLWIIDPIPRRIAICSY